MDEKERCGIEKNKDERNSALWISVEDPMFWRFGKTKQIIGCNAIVLT